MPSSVCFNPRAPCGARRGALFFRPRPRAFQPTRPVRGATCTFFPAARLCRFQPTRPVRGATVLEEKDPKRESVSTHAPRAGRDSGRKCAGRFGEVSTHAPRAGRDHRNRLPCDSGKGFNPRAPCGARLDPQNMPKMGRVSTHAPRAGRDRPPVVTVADAWVSTHAPRAGRDCLFGFSYLALVVSTHAPRAGRDNSPTLASVPPA